MTTILAMALLSAPACHHASPSEPTVPGSIPGFTLSGNPASSDGATLDVSHTGRLDPYDLPGHFASAVWFRPVLRRDHQPRQQLERRRLLAHDRPRDGAVGTGLHRDQLHARGRRADRIARHAASETSARRRPTCLRARRLVEILRGLGIVDMSRVALHGHSPGASVRGHRRRLPDLVSRRIAQSRAGVSRPISSSTSLPVWRRPEAQIAASARRTRCITATATSSSLWLPTSLSTPPFAPAA